MKRKVLLVDQNKAISFLIETLLEKQYEVCPVQDSYFAINELASNKSFDLIIVSVDSKQDDNFQLLQHLKTSSLLRKIPVLVLANGSDANLGNECAELCVEAYVEKPFDPLIFLYKINTLLLGRNENKPVKRHLKILSLNFYF